MDQSDTDIVFDSDGVCNHCLHYRKVEKERKLQKQYLQWVYHRMRMAGKGKKYDCLLGLSGGADSSTCLIKLVENGIRPLCFSMDNGWNTKESDENIMRLVEGLKVPFIRHVIDLKKFRELQQAFIESNTANIEIPTDHIITAVSYQIAIREGIKYIISGGNWSTESIMPESYGYQPRDLTFIKSVYKQFNGKKLSGLPTMSLLQYLYYRFIKQIEIVNLLDYYEYHRIRAMKELGEKFGWKHYGEKHGESVFTKWFQNYWLPVRFGIDKRRAHYSSMINSKQITRDIAVKLLELPLEFPHIDLPPRIVDGIYRGGKRISSYKDYPNSEKLWLFLSKIYGYLSRRK